MDERVRHLQHENILQHISVGKSVHSDDRLVGGHDMGLGLLALALPCTAQ